MQNEHPLERAEKIAKKTVIWELLRIAQTQDEVVVNGQKHVLRSAYIDKDEKELIESLLPTLGVEKRITDEISGMEHCVPDVKLFNETALEYFRLRTGKDPQVHRAIKGEKNQAYQRLHAFLFLRNQIVGMTGDADRLSIGTSLSQAKVTNDILTHYGTFFGMPMDDMHLVHKGVRDPLRVYIPQIKKFEKKQYIPLLRRIRKKMPSFTGIPGHILTHGAGEVSESILECMLSKSVQANYFEFDPEVGSLCGYTGRNIDALLTSIFDFTPQENGWGIYVGDIKMKVLDTYRQRNGGIERRDDETHRTVEQIVKNPAYNQGSEKKMELVKLMKLRPAYDKITDDGEFSPSEFALMNYALECIGIRQQRTRDLILDVQRDADWRVAGFSFDNLDQIYGSAFYRRSLETQPRFSLMD